VKQYENTERGGGGRTLVTGILLRGKTGEEHHWHTLSEIIWNSGILGRRKRGQKKEKVRRKNLSIIHRKRKIGEI